MTTRAIPLSDVLEETDERLGKRLEPEVLTLTERNGFLSQRVRFNKRLAVEDTSGYKVVRRFDIAFNPYLLWAGAVAQNVDWDEGIISPLYPTFRLRTGYEPRFVDRLLRSPGMVARYDGIAFGSVPRRRRTSVDDFLALKIPEPPPLPEQRRIAEILDRADALRGQRHVALAQLDTLTQSIFLDMFGDPATNPKQWPIETIGELLESASYGTSEKAEAAGEFPVLRMNNITRQGEMDFSDLKYMDLDQTQRGRYLVRAGDVLFNRTNSADLVGKTALYRNHRPMAYAGYLIRLRVKPDNTPEYLAAFLNSAYAKRLLRGMCKSIIGMANINATEVQSIRIAKPDVTLQRQFSECITAAERLRVAQRALLSEHDNLFSSLQSRAFAGGL